jgi:hypothetical protein
LKNSRKNNEWNNNDEWDGWREFQRWKEELCQNVKLWERNFGYGYDIR